MKDIFPVYAIGHFINQPANPTEFEILRFDEMDEPDVDEIHKHRFYEILWVEKGRSRQTIDYKTYEVLPHSLFFISPNQVHEFEGCEAFGGGDHFIYGGFFFCKNDYNKDKLFELSFLDDYYTNPCIALMSKDFAEVKQTIDGMAAEQRRKDRSDTIVQSLLHILLAQVQRCVDRAAGEVVHRKYLVLYKQFKQLLDVHFAENKTSAYFAGRLNITQHHLNLIVKDITGRMASQVIRARSILEAKRMLTFTDRSIGEIASLLNYFDSSYFAKLFRLETGKSPLAFKNEMSDKYRRR